MNRLKGALLPLLFLCLIIGSLLADIAWIRDDHAIMGCDVPNHLAGSVEYYYRLSDILGDAGASPAAKVSRAVRSVFEPLPDQGKRFTNLLYATTYPFYAAFGQNLLSARVSSFAWLLPLLFAVFLLGKELHSPAAGITAAGLVALHPAVFSSACQYGLDLPLTAVTAWCLLFLAKSRHFADRRYSLLLGAGIAAGLFLKFYIFLFIGAPFVFALAGAFAKREDERGARARLLNMGITLFPVALAVAAWWGGGGKDILSLTGLSLRTLPGLAAGYFHNLTMFILGPLLAALAVPGACLLARSKREDRWFYLTSFLAPLAVFLVLYCVLPAWQERWAMPVIPIGALIAAGGIHRIRNTRALNGTLAAVMLLASVTFCRVIFLNDISWRPPHYDRRAVDPVFHTSPALFQKHIYKNDRYGIRELLAAVPRSGAPARMLAVMLGPQAEQVVETFELTYWARSFNRDLEVCDLFVMFDRAYASLDSFEYLLLQLPYSERYDGWPPYEEFVRLARTMPDPYTLLRLSRSPAAGDLIPALYRQVPRYTLVKTVRTPFKYDWHLYERDPSRIGVNGS